MIRHTTYRPDGPRAVEHWPVVELRRYTLRPGARETLIDLFDREFVESQEAVGIRVLGQFRDEDAADRFVWLRGFHGMHARAEALTAFYVEGAAWRAHGAAANATMIDFDDVLLLRPVTPEAGFPLPADRPGVGEGAAPESRIMATVYHLDAPVDDGFVRFFDDEVRPVMAESGAAPIAVFVTEPAENTFPRLPVRTGVNVLVWFAAFENTDGYRAHLDRLARSEKWNQDVLPRLSARLRAPAERLRLAPTARSLLR
jgi:hypothetical protein